MGVRGDLHNLCRSTTLLSKLQIILLKGNWFSFLVFTEILNKKSWLLIDPAYKFNSKIHNVGDDKIWVSLWQHHHHVQQTSEGGDQTGGLMMSTWNTNSELRENKHWHTPPEALYISARVWYPEWGNIWRLLRLRTCTCGMMVSLERRSCSPISAIFTSSMVISPAAASSSLKRHSVMDDLPAPVRPTIPIWLGKYRLIGGVGHFWLARRPPEAGPHLLSSSDAQRELLEDEVQSLPVANAVVVELHVAMRGPISRRLLVRHLPGGLWAESAALGKLFLNNSLARLVLFFFSRTDLSITPTGFKESKDHAVRSHSEQPNICFTSGTHWEVQNKGFRYNGSNSARRTPCCNSCDKAWTCIACTAAETPWLAGSRPTLLDLIRVYGQLGGRMFCGMCVILVLGVF